MPEARLVLDSGPLSASTAALERSARLYDQIAKSQEQITRLSAQSGQISGRVSDALQIHAQLRGSDQAAQIVAAGRGGVSTTRARAAAEREYERFTEGVKRDFARGVARETTQKQGPDFASRALTAVRSTRFGAGPVQPLVGRTLDVLGVSAGAALPLAIAGAALAGFIEVVRSSTQALSEFRGAALVSGGTTGQVAGLRAMGLSGEEIAGRGAGLRGVAQSGDPFATIRALSAGVSILPGELGNVNQARQLQGAVEYLRVIGQTRGAEDQLRAARSLNMEWALREANASDKVWRAWQLDAKAAEGVFNPRATDAAMELQQQTERLATNWNTLRTTMGSPFIGLFADRIGKLADTARTAAQGDFWDKIFATAGGAPWHDPKGFWHWLNEGMDSQDQPGAAAKNHKDALDENTDAIRQLVSETRGLRRDITGGGPVATGAMPSLLSGKELYRGLTSDRFRLGAFRVWEGRFDAESALV